MPAYTHAHHCSLLKTDRKTTLWLIVLHKKEFNYSIEVKYMRKFELLFGYTKQAICHKVYKDNSCAQVDLCCILFEYSFMHMHGGKSGTRVLTQNVPRSIF